jgi:hypothetical protein
MATRFYLVQTGVAAISPAFDAGWGQTGQADRLRLVLQSDSKAATTLTDKTVTIPITTTQNILNRQFVSEPLTVPTTISGTISAVVRCLESALTANGFLQIVARVVSFDGITVRGTLFSGATDLEFDATATTRINFGGAVTTVNALQGDRVVVEIGVAAAAPTAATTATQRFGNSATTDFALTSALTTDLNPWVEFSTTFTVSKPMSNNNYQFVKVGDGMSVTERIR